MTDRKKEKNKLTKMNLKDLNLKNREWVINLSSNLDKLSPEVAKEIIDKFPDFISSAKELLMSQKEVLLKGLEHNNENVKACNHANLKIIESLEKELEKENLSLDDKMSIFERMEKIANQMGDKDKDNKKFLGGIATVGMASLTIIVTALSLTVGGKIDIK